MIYPQKDVRIAGPDYVFGGGLGLGGSGASSGGPPPSNTYIDASSVNYTDASGLAYTTS